YSRFYGYATLRAFEDLPRNFALLLLSSRLLYKSTGASIAQAVLFWAKYRIDASTLWNLVWARSRTGSHGPDLLRLQFLRARAMKARTWQFYEARGSQLVMKGKSYTFFIASTPGKLRKLIVPAYLLYGLGVFAVIGCVTVTAAVGSYTRMLWKVGNYNALRHD